MIEKIRAHIFVTGRVQGVFYREKCRKNAQKLGIFGFVKNLRDGKVEAVFEGEEDKVKKLVDWARRGPIWAKVDNFEVLWEDDKGEFNNFEIRYDFE